MFVLGTFRGLLLLSRRMSWTHKLLDKCIIGIGHFKNKSSTKQKLCTIRMKKSVKLISAFFDQLVLNPSYAWLHLNNSTFAASGMQLIVPINNSDNFKIKPKLKHLKRREKWKSNEKYWVKFLHSNSFYLFKSCNNFRLYQKFILSLKN